MTEETEGKAEAGPAQNPKRDDYIVTHILDAVAGGADVSPRDVAMRIAAERAKPTDRPDLWRKYLQAVNQQARFLARQGRIQIIRKGEIVDPDEVRGLVKLRRA